MCKLLPISIPVNIRDLSILGVEFFASATARLLQLLPDTGCSSFCIQLCIRRINTFKYLSQVYLFVNPCQNKQLRSTLPEF